MISSVLLLAVCLLPGATPQGLEPPPPTDSAPTVPIFNGLPPLNTTPFVDPPTDPSPPSQPPLNDAPPNQAPSNGSPPPLESLDAFGLPFQGQACDQQASVLLPRTRGGNASMCYTECLETAACRFFQVDPDGGCTMYSKCTRTVSTDASTLVYEKEATGPRESQPSNRNWESATYALLVLALVLVTINVAMFCHILLRRHKAQNAARGGSLRMEKQAPRSTPGSFSMPMAPPMHSANTRDAYMVDMTVPMAPAAQAPRLVGATPRKKMPFAGMFAAVWRCLKPSPPERPPTPASTTSMTRFEPQLPKTVMQNGESRAAGCDMSALRILTPPGNWSLQSAFEAELKACCPPGRQNFTVHTMVAFAVTDETLDQDLVTSLQSMDASLLSGDGRTAVVLVHTRCPDESPLPTSEFSQKDAHALLTNTYSIKCVDMYRWEGDFACHRDANRSALHSLLSEPVPAPQAVAAASAEGDNSVRDDTLDLFDMPSDEEIGIVKAPSSRPSPFVGRNVGKSLPFTPLERVAEGSREYLSSSSLQSSI